MKTCLFCNERFTTQGWVCPNCGHVPDTSAGFPVFAKELTTNIDDFSPELHDVLDSTQENSFWFRARNRLITSLIEKHRLFRPGDANSTRILEVGCGTGYTLSAIAARFPEFKITGSDPHINALSMAERRLTRDVELIQMDGRKIPFENEFDLVCAFDVLEHVEDDREVLRHIFRSVRPGGTIFLSVPQHPRLWSAADEIAGHKRRYKRGELVEKMIETGFTISQSTGFVFFLLPAMYANRKLGSKTHSPQQDLQLPKIIDIPFEMVMRFERFLIGLGVTLPWGGSAFAIGKKPE